MIHWKKNGKLESALYTPGSVEIPPVSKYLCIIMNRFGTLSRETLGIAYYSRLLN